MKQNDLFQDLKPEDRAAALEHMAEGSDMQNIRRYYSPEEINQMKDFTANEGINLMTKEEEFAEIKKEFNKAIKEYKTQIKGALKDMKRGYSENMETVYNVADHENDEIHIYDSKGIYLSSRRMRPEERQTKIVELQQTAN